jgi:hypothetical protein
MQQYPLLQRRGRGDCAGRAEIAFCEGLNYEDAQHVADAIAAKLQLVVANRLNGPDAWLWDAHHATGRFVFSYNDELREVTLFASDLASDDAVAALFAEFIARYPAPWSDRRRIESR